MKKLISTFIGAGLSLSISAHADERISIGGYGGAHLFSENLELGAFDTSTADSPRSSVAFGVRVGYELISHLRWEGELAIMPTKTRESGDDLSVFAWRTHALIDLLPEQRLRPFALLGMGFLTAAPVAPEVLEEDTDLAGHVGFGFEFDMAATWSLRVDVRAVFAPTVLSDYVTTDFEFFIGAIKRFPTPPTPVPKDEDGDGVFAGDDLCPDEVEDQDGYEDEDGCPDLDNDNDGVPDTQDQCPAEAETKNGIDDEDGCPEPDGDGDGVLGSQDKCPQEAENINGIEDQDGCPEVVATPSPEPVVDAVVPNSPEPAKRPSKPLGELPGGTPNF